jgi:small subunit ribosomal protein S21
LSEVRVLRGESIDAAIRRFKKVVDKDSVLRDLARSDHFIGPSEQRRRKSAAARKRLAKA